jgi:hypothetical protein
MTMTMTITMTMTMTMTMADTRMGMTMMMMATHPSSWLCAPPPHLGLWVDADALELDGPAVPAQHLHRLRRLHTPRHKYRSKVLRDVWSTKSIAPWGLYTAPVNSNTFE